MRIKDVTVCNSDAFINLKEMKIVGIYEKERKIRLRWANENKTVDTDMDRFRPIMIKSDHKNEEIKVTWIDFADLSIEDSFFLFAVKKSIRSKLTSDRFQSGGKLLRLVASCSEKTDPSGFIFHLTRSGSTLIHHLINSSVSVHSLSEPSVFEQAIFVSRKWSIIDRTRLIRDVMACYTPIRHIGQEKFFVKVANAMDVISLQAAFPNVPWIFVYREPSEIIVSILNRASGFLEKWQEDRNNAAEILGLSYLGDPNMNVEEFIARVLGHMCENIANAAKSTPQGNFLAVQYSRLPYAVWETIAPHFNINLSKDDLEEIIYKSRFSAKSSTETEFEEDTILKRNQITNYIRDLSEKYIEPHLSEIRLLPHG